MKPEPFSKKGANDSHASYLIRIEGCLSPDLAAWLDVPTRFDPNRGETDLLLPSNDQAFLFGVLNRLRDLGLKLISVEQVPDRDPLA